MDILLKKISFLYCVATFPAFSASPRLRPGGQGLQLVEAGGCGDLLHLF